MGKTTYSVELILGEHYHDDIIYGSEVLDHKEMKFDNKEDASEAYCQAAKDNHKDFANY